jgi:hypothetical protein
MGAPMTMGSACCDLAKSGEMIKMANTKMADNKIDLFIIYNLLLLDLVDNIE